MKQTKLSFTPPTLNTDGSPITEPLSYSVFIDTVNPPVKNYSVATPNVVGGVVTLNFTDLGFVPVQNTTYYVDVEATDADGISAPSIIDSFKYDVVPQAPTGLTVG